MKDAPTPPTPPDPNVVSAAQSKANIDSATAQQRLNMVNTSSPYGTVNYTPDQSAPGGYAQTTTLSPSQQGLYDLGTQAQTGALQVANQQIGRVGQALSQGLNPGDYGALTYNVDGGPIQHSFNQGQAVQGDVGDNNASGAVKAVTDAYYNQARSRLDPQWQQQEQQLNDSLANQGIGINSAAYGNAKDILGRSKNDAYNQAIYSSIGQGANEQNTLYNQALQSGQFHNAAAGQQYQQNMGSAEFANNAQNQGFNQGLANAQLNNTAQQQGFQQAAYAQSLPIQEFSQLLGNGQVQNPQGISYTPSQVANTDTLGAYALNTQAQQSAYQSQLQKQASDLQGLFKLGGAALTAFA
jgi:hypothetical protein